MLKPHRNNSELPSKLFQLLNNHTKQLCMPVIFAGKPNVGIKNRNFPIDPHPSSGPMHTTLIKHTSHHLLPSSAPLASAAAWCVCQAEVSDGIYLDVEALRRWCLPVGAIGHDLALALDRCLYLTVCLRLCLCASGVTDFRTYLRNLDEQPFKKTTIITTVSWIC